MKKSLANQIVRVWNEKHAGIYEPTRTKAVVMNSSRKDDFFVEILPDKGNDGASFHHQEEMTDVMRAFKVSAYVAVRTDEVRGGALVIGRLF